MTIPPTSSLSGRSRAALFDELLKIAEAEVQKPKTSPLKKALKIGALSALGYTAGHGGAMLADKALSHIFRNKYPNWTPEFKHKVLYPLLGAASLGSTLATHYTLAKRREAMERDE